MWVRGLRGLSQVSCLVVWLPGSTYCISPGNPAGELPITKQTGDGV